MNIADLVAKLEGHDPADDLQWLSGGVGRVLADSERSIVIGRLGERIDFWVEVWPEVRAIVVAAQAWEKAKEERDEAVLTGSQWEVVHKRQERLINAERALVAGLSKRKEI